MLGDPSSLREKLCGIFFAVMLRIRQHDDCGSSILGKRWFSLDQLVARVGFGGQKLWAPRQQGRGGGWPGESVARCVVYGEI
jgi:hypothetical protein